MQGQHLHLLEDGATRIAELEGTPATGIRQDNPVDRDVLHGSRDVDDVLQRLGLDLSTHRCTPTNDPSTWSDLGSVQWIDLHHAVDVVAAVVAEAKDLAATQTVSSNKDIWNRNKILKLFPSM